MRLPKSSPARRSLASVTFASLVLALFSIPSHAEIDGDRKDGKKAGEAKEEPRAELGGDGADEFENLHQKLVDDGEQNLREIHELMKKIQGDLANKQTGEPIQKRQETVVDKIEELIDKLAKAAQQQQSGASGQQNEQQKQSGSQQDQKQGGRQQQNKQDSGMKPGQQKQGEQEKQSEKERYGPTRHDRTSDGKLPPARTKTLHDVLRSEKQWGLLPEKLQDIVRSSKGKELPAEYKELIANYYKKLGDALVEKDR